MSTCIEKITKLDFTCCLEEGIPIACKVRVADTVKLFEVNVRLDLFQN